MRNCSGCCAAAGQGGFFAKSQKGHPAFIASFGMRCFGAHRWPGWEVRCILKAESRQPTFPGAVSRSSGREDPDPHVIRRLTWRRL